MRFVSLACASCDDIVKVMPHEITLVINSHRQGYYVFDCDLCEQTIVGRVSPVRVKDMIRAGCQVRFFDIPAEYFEDKSGPPISGEDIEIMTQLLQYQDWQELLLLWLQDSIRHLA